MLIIAWLSMESEWQVIVYAHYRDAAACQAAALEVVKPGEKWWCVKG